MLDGVSTRSDTFQSVANPDLAVPGGVTLVVVLLEDAEVVGPHIRIRQTGVLTRARLALYSLRQTPWSFRRRALAALSIARTTTTLQDVNWASFRLRALGRGQDRLPNSSQHQITTRSAANMLHSELLASLTATERVCSERLALVGGSGSIMLGLALADDQDLVIESLVEKGLVRIDPQKETLSLASETVVEALVDSLDATRERRHIDVLATNLRRLYGLNVTLHGYDGFAMSIAADIEPILNTHRLLFAQSRAEVSATFRARRSGSVLRCRLLDRKTDPG